MAGQRLEEWQKDHAEEYPEELTKDKAKLVHAGKPAKKGKKIFLIEYKWKSQEDFVKYRRPYWKGFTYSDQWQHNDFGCRFHTLEGARDSFKTIRPHMGLNNQVFHDPVSGRNWRIRNEVTGEITELC